MKTNTTNVAPRMINSLKAKIVNSTGVRDVTWVRNVAALLA